MITYTNEDCMELMKRYKDNHFDLAIVDPPYGINVNISMGRRKNDIKSDYHKFHGGDVEPPQESYFKELERVSKNQIIWGANYFIDKLQNPNSKNWIVWDKLFSNNVSFASAELAWSNLDSTVKIYRQSPNSSNRIHPTQKPVALYKWLLNNYAKQGDLILDTHVGSASSLIACYDLGFDAVACELDKDYYNESNKRLDYFMKQPKIVDIPADVYEQIELGRPDYTRT